MENSFPEFKKIEMIANGKLIETFFINDKEVEESVYYTLLEDRTNIYTKFNKKEKAKSKKVDIDDDEFEKDEMQKEQEYIQGILDLLEDNSDEAFYILYDELVYTYKLGYLMGQLDTNDAYQKSMKQNFREIQYQIDDLVDEYEKE
jgi:hypothetical protein